ASRDAGDPGWAVPLFEQTLKLRKARLGPDHPETLRTMHNLGKAYWMGKRFDRSIALAEEVSKRQEARLGRDHLATVEALANLGVNYKSAGRLDKAIPLLEEALRAAKQYPQLLAFTPELLDAYEKAGKKGGRVEVLEQTLEFRNETCGPDHPDTLRVRDLLVVAYRD